MSRLSLPALALPLLLLSAWPSSAALPASPRAPAVGDAAPDFTLPAADGTTVHLRDVVRRTTTSGAKPWTLLVFYRGYW